MSIVRPERRPGLGSRREERSDGAECRQMLLSFLFSLKMKLFNLNLLDDCCKKY